MLQDRRWDALREDVHALLRRHLKDGYSGLLGREYCYIRPAPKRYPFQWFWDSCFHIFMLVRLGEFATPVPLPSLAVCDPAFCAGQSPYIWRGPTWAQPNWFLYHALARRGREALAQRLRQALWRCVEKSGFREYYNPYTAEGYGAHDFTWSGLLLDMQEHGTQFAAGGA